VGIRMATYQCAKCSMSVNPTCGKCSAPLVNGHAGPDGKIQVAQCPNKHGKIKSPLCCGQDMVCAVAKHDETKLKLTYFNIPARAEAIRLALYLGGVPFEDIRVEFKDWPAKKLTTPFGHMPLLEVDGLEFCEILNLLEYAGEMGGLSPRGVEGLIVREIISLGETEIRRNSDVPKTASEEEKKALRKAFQDGPVTKYLERIQQRIKASGGPFLIGEKISIADLHSWLLYQTLQKGTWDYIDKDLLDRFPLCLAQRKALEDHPKLKEYYAAKTVAA